MLLSLLSFYYCSFLYIRFLIKLCYLSKMRNHAYPKLSYQFRRLIFCNFGFLFSFCIYAAFQIIIDTNFHTRHIKLSGGKTRPVVHDSIKIVPTLIVRKMMPLPDMNPKGNRRQGRSFLIYFRSVQWNRNNSVCWMLGSRTSIYEQYRRLGWTCRIFLLVSCLP